jgi:outer membrane lipoprotein SlyB
MDNKEEMQLEYEEKSLRSVLIDLKGGYKYVIVGLGVGAITLGTCGYIIAGSMGASLLGGVGGAIGGLAGATEQENISKTESP